ncbi:hypothetical protein Tco_0539159, partial [Tanacetum coccineum]
DTPGAGGTGAWRKTGRSNLVCNHLRSVTGVGKCKSKGQSTAE